MKKTAIILMIITLLSKVLGLVRETTLAYFFPTNGPVANAFLVSQILPITIVSLFSAGISTSFIPIYNKIVHEKGKGRRRYFYIKYQQYSCYYNISINSNTGDFYTICN